MVTARTTAPGAPARSTELLRTIRIVVRVDSDPARQALFARLVESNLAVRLAFRLHERVGGTWLPAVLVGGFGLASFLSIGPPSNPAAQLVAVARYANSRRRVHQVFEWVGPAECTLLGDGAGSIVGAFSLAGLAGCARRGRFRRMLRIIRTVDARHGFLVACRAAVAIAWYARARTILGSHRPSVVVVASDSNPEELGFLGAARALGIPQVFVSHAYPTPLSPPLDFHLSILEGEAAVRARERTAPIRGAVLLAGLDGESARMEPGRFARPHPVVGVFASKAFSWPALAAIVRDCRGHLQAARILIRWHPSMLEQPRLASVLGDLSGIVETPASAELADVARQCDWVVADENSNVHLPVLKLGIPTVAIRHLGVYPDSRADQYGFVANGIIPPPLESLRDVRPGALAAFFSDAWAARFSQYDAAYGRSPDVVPGQVRTAIRRFFDAPGVERRPDAVARRAVGSSAG